jgi:hypothetical protein
MKWHFIPGRQEWYDKWKSVSSLDHITGKKKPPWPMYLMQKKKVLDKIYDKSTKN